MVKKLAYRKQLQKLEKKQFAKKNTDWDALNIIKGKEIKRKPIQRKFEINSFGTTLE